MQNPAGSLPQAAPRLGRYSLLPKREQFKEVSPNDEKFQGGSWELNCLAAYLQAPLRGALVCWKSQEETSPPVTLTMISGLFWVNQKGEIVISRLYRDDVSVSAANAFRAQVRIHSPPTPP
jgi:hypothetical protein